MIDISKLTESDKGRWVRFRSEKGRIKHWNPNYIYVVYHCNDDWGNYSNYIAEATEPLWLTFIDKGATNESP